MKTIDLNCDLGESFGRYKLGMDEDILRYVSSANIACGWHAGDALVMLKTVKMASELGVGIGAHPGYPDLQGFGRRKMECSHEEIKAYVMYQIGALKAFCTDEGVFLQHVKPHGALYNTAAEDEDTAWAIAEAVAAVDKNLILVTLAGPKGVSVSRAAKEFGLKVAFEAFPDRAYTPEGTLAPRNLPGAVVNDPDEVKTRALKMAKEGKVIATDGTEIGIDAQTLCVHGDTPGAINLVKAIKETFESEGLIVKPMGE